MHQFQTSGTQLITSALLHGKRYYIGILVEEVGMGAGILSGGKLQVSYVAQGFVTLVFIHNLLSFSYLSSYV
jgi:hypothetical protein